MSDDDSTSSTDPYDTGPGSTLEEIKADLDNSKDTTIADINGLFEWLSLRKGGGRAAKVSKLLAIYNDGFPNVLRLARDCYHRENHRDASLLENITTDNRRTANFNEDGLLLHDFLYDESTGRYSVTADGASPPEPEDAAGGSIVLSHADFAALQARLAAVESGGGGGGGGLDEHQVLALIDKSKKEARAELLTDIREGREVVDTWASKDDRRQATAYELGDDFAIFDFERAPVRANTANLYDNANPETSLRKLVFFSTIRDDDKKKILRRTALPSFWADPPSINPANRHKFTEAQLKRDKELRDLQEKMLPTFQITTKCLDLSCRTHAECELLRDDIAADDGRDLVSRLDSIQQKLDDVIFGLSDDFVAATEFCISSKI